MQLGDVAADNLTGHAVWISDLKRLVDGISQRILTTTLRNLEWDCFLKRDVFSEVPPRVEYELTALGMNLLGPMEHLVGWTGDNWPSIRDARQRFDQQAAKQA